MLLKLTHSVHLLIFLYISVPHPSQSQSTLHNRQSTDLPLLLLLIWWLLPLLMFPPTVGKSKCSYVLSEMFYFYDLENIGAFGAVNRIWRETNKTGSVPGKPGRMGSLFLPNNDSIIAFIWRFLLQCRNAQGTQPSRTIHRTECGAVIACHIRLSAHKANGVTEPVSSSCSIVSLSNTASTDVETLD